MWCSFWCQGSGPISLVSCFSKAFEKCVWKKKVFSCILNCTTCNMVLCREGRWKQIFYHFFNTLARECAPVSKLTPLILILMGVLAYLQISVRDFLCTFLIVRILFMGLGIFPCPTSLSGVPQGSVLGFSLFNAYANGLCESIRYSRFVQYADDLKNFSALNH